MLKSKKFLDLNKISYTWRERGVTLAHKADARGKVRVV